MIIAVLLAQKNSYIQDFTNYKTKWSLLGKVSKHSATVAVTKGYSFLIVDTVYYRLYLTKNDKQIK